MRNCATLFEPELVPPDEHIKSKESWRLTPTLFTKHNGALLPGVLNFSSAWFMLGNEVRV